MAAKEQEIARVLALDGSLRIDGVVLTDATLTVQYRMLKAPSRRRQQDLFGDAPVNWRAKKMIATVDLRSVPNGRETPITILSIAVYGAIMFGAKHTAVRERYED